MRVTLADVVEAQRLQVERLLEQVRADRELIRELATMFATALAAFTEQRKPTASEELTLSRSKLADKATGVDVKVVRQPDESIEEWGVRGATVFEAECGRFPLPNGTAHAAELGDGLDAWRETLANGAGLHAVPDPEETA